MLTRKQREQAQRRFVERLNVVEVTAGLTLYAVIADAKTKAAKRVTKIVAEAQKADDPTTAVMMRLPEIRRVIAEEMGAESVVAGAATAISASRREALLVGAQEGTRRVSEATNRPAVAVSADRLSARQKQSDQDSEVAAARWTEGTIEQAQRGTVMEAIIVVGTAIDIKQIGDVLEKAVTSRSAFGARNEVTGSARDGIMDAFRENDQAGWVWIAEEDACEFCWGMAGLVFDITEELDSHPNCRCSQEPVEDINDPNAGFDPTTIFNELTAEEQTAVLGRQGYEDYRAGDLTLRDAAVERGARVSNAQLSRDDLRMGRYQRSPTEHMPGYEPLPGSQGRLPGPVQDFIREMTGTSPTATERAAAIAEHRAAGLPGDPQFDEIMRLLDKDGPPSLVTDAEIDRVVAAGEKEVFAAFDSADDAEAFVTGAYKSERTAYGSGYRASSDLQESYSGWGKSSDDAAGLRRMSLKSDAKVFDYEDFLRQVREEIGGSPYEMRRSADDILAYNTSNAARSLIGSNKAKFAGRLDEATATYNDAIEKLRPLIIKQLEKEASSMTVDDAIDLVVRLKSRGSPIPIRFGKEASAALSEAAVARGEVDYLEKRIAESAGDDTSIRDFALKGQGLSREQASTLGALNKYDAIRLTNDGMPDTYIILNRDAVRVGDTRYKKVDGKFVKASGGDKSSVQIAEEQLMKEIDAAAEARAAQARKLAERLDKQMKALEWEVGGELEGLSHSVKSAESLARKIRSTIRKAEDKRRLAPPLSKAGKAGPMTVEEAVAQMRDVNRYTITFDEAMYGEKVEAAVARLREQGYEFVEEFWKNTWERGGSYRGLNATMRAPDGGMIEIQFHTPESYRLKSRNHKLYEEARLDSTSPERKAELNQQMIDDASAVNDPEGWDRLDLPPRAAGGYAPGTLKPSEELDVFVAQRGPKKKVMDGVHLGADVMDDLLRVKKRPLQRRLEVKYEKEFQGTSRGADAYYSSHQIDGVTRSGHIGMSTEALREGDTNPFSVAHGFIHEYGHYIDAELLDTAFMSRLAQDPSSPLHKWYVAVTESDMMEQFAGKVDLFGASQRTKDYYEYLTSQHELWARSFAQWVTLRSGGKVGTTAMMRADHALLEEMFGVNAQWADKDFEKIAEAFDELFRERGWML
jgi:hypothetical protein